VLELAISSTKHEFWPDDLSVVDRDRDIWIYCLGHRQVTDAYLLDLARRKNGKLATFDAGIAALVADQNARSKLLEFLPG
jgi:predicted nucleic acid-binding protein